MIDRFLKAKHWQIFLLTIGIPMIFQFVMMGIMISNLANQTNLDPMIMFDFMKYFPLILLFFMAVTFAWFWSVAIGLQKKVPETVRMKIKKFKIFFFIPLLYMLIFLLYFSLAVNELLGFNPDIEFIGMLFLIVFPLHIFSMFCIFYSLYFVAKTFKTVELQREVRFGDFAGEFFMIWFYPIGIWILQPKINKMMEE